MYADEDLFLKLSTILERVEDICEPFRNIYVLGPMERDEKIFERLRRDLFQYLALRYLVVEIVQDLADRISGYEDALPLNSLGHQVLFASFGIRKKYRARMVDDPAIHFLRNPIVVTTVAGFHVKNRDPASSRDDRRQSAVRVAEYQYLCQACARRDASSTLLRIWPICSPNDYSSEFRDEYRACSRRGP